MNIRFHRTGRRKAFNDTPKYDYDAETGTQTVAADADPNAGWDMRGMYYDTLRGEFGLVSWELVWDGGDTREYGMYITYMADCGYVGRWVTCYDIIAADDMFTFEAVQA